MAEYFGVFLNNGRDSMWRCQLNDVTEAKRKAQEIATIENTECIVYSLDDLQEIARFYPPLSGETRAEAKHDSRR